jgi:hypothetical protein
MDWERLPLFERLGYAVETFRDAGINQGDFRFQLCQVSHQGRKAIEDLAFPPAHPELIAAFQEF